MQFSRKAAPLLGLAAVAAFGLAAPRPAAAQVKTFDLTYSGADYGNTATATAIISIDLGQLNNPGYNEQDINPFIKDFSITVSAARSGNGTFHFSEYGGLSANGGFFLLDSNGGTLDLTKSLIGQPTAGSPFGTTFDGTSGDFNIFPTDTAFTAGAPSAADTFQITTDGASGDRLKLTSFAPAPVPEASTTVSFGLLLALGLGGMVIAARRKKAAGEAAA